MPYIITNLTCSIMSLLQSIPLKLTVFTEYQGKAVYVNSLSMHFLWLSISVTICKVSQHFNPLKNEIVQ